MKNIKCFLALFSVIVLFTGCAITPKNTHDLSTYTAHMPKSILVMPPINESPDTRATYGYWSSVALPVAEAGYYVFPITVVDTMFKENGITNGFDAQSVAPQKLQEIFGADAALYVKVKEYGSKYQVIQSMATVAVEAKLVDLKTGNLLWEGQEKVQQANDNNGGGLVGMLVGALVDQISSHLSDKAYVLSNHLSSQLYTPQLGQQKGLLYGPRSPNFSKNSVSPQ
ncbi:DUF799 domain-containing protein [Acinetobacter sp. ANC 4648]|uniref:DUF799 domain-containing protein n=1 Tax=Acinetobacter sp. ANC 4648 TaxID=1977875 RepID=UPI000A33DFC9|nr:GNA1162 family protein [Acinetobacter sp. ANC 4648]OTG83849.1 hypothetical protein B9T27_04960 [Acinetobacter sp. ANC 4648]